MNWELRRTEMADDITEGDSAEKEFFAAWALFISIMLLIIAFFTSYMLQQKKVTAIHETVISIFAGIPQRHLARLPRLALTLSASRHGRWPHPAHHLGRLHPKPHQLRLPNLLQPSPPAHHPVFRIRAAPGQLLSQHWHDPDVRIRRHLSLRRRHRADLVDLQPGPWISGVDAGRCYFRRCNALCHRSRHHLGHLQHVQGRSQAVHHHLWRIDPQRRHCHCHLRDRAKV